MPWSAMVQGKRENPVENAQVASTLLNAGVPLKVVEIMEKTGFTPPKRNPETGEWEEDVIEGKKPVSPVDSGGPRAGGRQALWHPCPTRESNSATTNPRSRCDRRWSRSPAVVPRAGWSDRGLQSGVVSLMLGAEVVPETGRSVCSARRGGRPVVPSGTGMVARIDRGPWGAPVSRRDGRPERVNNFETTAKTF